MDASCTFVIDTLLSTPCCNLLVPWCANAGLSSVRSNGNAGAFKTRSPTSLTSTMKFNSSATKTPQKNGPRLRSSVSNGPEFTSESVSH